jgi:hypothetical protein
MAVLGSPQFPVLPFMQAKAKSMTLGGNMSILSGIILGIVFVAFSLGAYLWYVIPEPRELRRR